MRGLAACLATDDKESGKIRRLANASQQNMELRVVVVEDFNRNSESRGPPASHGQGPTGSRYPTRPELFFKYPTRPDPKIENDWVPGN